MTKLNLLASTALVCLLSACGGSSIIDRAIDELDPCQTNCDDGQTDGETDGGTDGGTDGNTDGGTDGNTDGGTDEETQGPTDEELEAIAGTYSVADSVEFKVGNNPTGTFTEDSQVVSVLQSQQMETVIDGDWSMTLDVTVADGAAKAVVTDSNVRIDSHPLITSHDLDLDTGEDGNELSPDGALTLNVNGELVWFNPQIQRQVRIDNVADYGSYLLIEGQIDEDGTAAGVSYDENTDNADLFIGLEQGGFGLGAQESGPVDTFSVVE